MKNKNNYAAPDIRKVSVKADSCFANSQPQNWYDEAGTGNFNYVIENDTTWE